MLRGGGESQKHPAICPSFQHDKYCHVLTWHYREAEAAKKAEQARKKAEKDALLAAEEKDAPKAVTKNKQAVKKSAPSRGTLDLGQLDEPAGGEKAAAGALNAANIDDALDALDITAGAGVKIDKHPERRFKAAYAAFEERRLKEMDEDGSGQGLRQNQKKDKIRKEFEKSPDKYVYCTWMGEYRVANHGVVHSTRSTLSITLQRRMWRTRGRPRRPSWRLDWEVSRWIYQECALCNRTLGVIS